MNDNPDYQGFKVGDLVQVKDYYRTYEKYLSWLHFDGQIASPAAIKRELGLIYEMVGLSIDVDVDDDDEVELPVLLIDISNSMWVEPTIAPEYVQPANGLLALANMV